MASSARKRNRPEDWEELEPSPVIHVSDLPEHTLEIDLIKAFERFGSIKDLTMIPQRGQALVEFTDLAVAGNAVVGCAKTPLLIGNHRLKVNYSTSKRIFQRQLTSSSSNTDGAREYPVDTSGPNEGRVLLLTIYNAQYPITVDVIYQITSPHGQVFRIVIFQKTHIQAMVEFKSPDDARAAKRNLNGADIYSGCCTLKVELARPSRLTVFKNDQETWDFENNALLPNDDARGRNGGDGRVNVSLLGRVDRHFDRIRPINNNNGNPRMAPNGDGQYGYHQNGAYPRSGPANQLPLGTPGGGPGLGGGGGGGPGGGGGNGNIFDQLALSVHPSLAGLGTPEAGGAMHGRGGTCVIMVYNMDISQMNCDRLFNLLCIYGNVARIKFLRSKEGSAMAQMGDAVSVDRVIRYLSGVPLLGNHLLVRPSKQLVIMDVLKPFELPDGSPSFKDFAWSRENRFTNPEKLGKNRIYSPSSTLHYWNCPPDLTNAELCQIFIDTSAEPPSRVAEFPSVSDRSSSGLLEWDNTEDAINAMAFTNHHAIPYPKGRFPFIMKLSFSNAPIQERAQSSGTHRKSANHTVNQQSGSPCDSSYR